MACRCGPRLGLLAEIDFRELPPSPTQRLLGLDERKQPTPAESRTIICRERLPITCDLLFAVRFTDDYTSLEALEVPRDVADDVYGDRGVHWTVLEGAWAPGRLARPLSPRAARQRMREVPLAVLKMSGRPGGVSLGEL